MTHRKLTELLNDPDAAGLAYASPEQVQGIRRAGEELAFKIWRVDLSDTPDEKALFAGFARELQFPDWYGHNWDALADCLNDLSWCEANGYVICLEGVAAFHARDPKAWETLTDVLRDASFVWREDGFALWTLLDSALDDVMAFPA